MAQHDGRLKWVARNRRREYEVTSAGELIAGLAGEAKDDDRVRAVASFLANIVDGEFRRSCLVAGLRGTTLIIHVKEPGMVGFMRSKWLATIAKDLRSAQRRIGATTVAFAFGRTGCPVLQPSAPAEGAIEKR